MIDTTTKSRFSVKQLTVIYTIISLLSLLVVWELAARFTSASMFLPPASQVLASFCRSFVEPIGKHTMLVHIGVSLYRVAVAFFFATVTGIALGVGMGYSRLLEAILKPLFEFIRPSPRWRGSRCPSCGSAWATRANSSSSSSGASASSPSTPTTAPRTSTLS